MSRQLQIEQAGGWYHLTARGNEPRAIFRDYGERAHFRELLGQMLERLRVRPHVFVLMDNHYHLIAKRWSGRGIIASMWSRLCARD